MKSSEHNLLENVVEIVGVPKINNEDLQSDN
jgi:hypothetical protein